MKPLMAWMMCEADTRFYSKHQVQEMLDVVQGWVNTIASHEPLKDYTAPEPILSECGWDGDVEIERTGAFDREGWWTCPRCGTKAPLTSSEMHALMGDD